MAEFRVIKAKVKVFPHPNAEKLELLKIGAFQAVVLKDVYKDGDIVVFAPEKSVLPEAIALSFRKYLKGSEKSGTLSARLPRRNSGRNRVGTIRLRGELSMGVIIPVEQVDPDDLFPYDRDISEKLGIVKYEPYIPPSLRGRVLPIIDFPYLRKHDVEQFRIYASEFINDEQIRIFEKIHGSQAIYLRNKNGEIAVSSKGIIKSDLTIEEDRGNVYWQAARNMIIFEILESLYRDRYVQLFGEVVPVQKRFSYGFTQPHVLFFKLIVDGKIQKLEEIPDVIKENWVPLLYEGKYDLDAIVPLCEARQFGGYLRIDESAP